MANADEPKSVTVSHEINFTSWLVDQQIAPELFTFAIPQDATQFTEIRNPNALLGTAAPELTLPTLDGPDFKLSDSKGKEMLVLYFWDIACPYCVKGMPDIVQLGKDYASKGVRFMTVNLGDSPEEVKAFRTGKFDEAPVAVDAKRLCGEMFRISGVPHLVVIDKQGSIAEVLVGVPKDLRGYMTDLVDQLLQKKSGS